MITIVLYTFKEAIKKYLFTFDKIWYLIKKHKISSIIY